VAIEAVKRDHEATCKNRSSYIAGCQDESNVVIGSQQGGKLHTHATHISLYKSMRGVWRRVVGEEGKLRFSHKTDRCMDIRGEAFSLLLFLLICQPSIPLVPYL